MNTFDFFNDNFGSLLVQQEKSKSSQENAARALSASHLMASGRLSRLGSGWAIVKKNNATLQLKLAADGIFYDDRTRYEAISDALEAWDNSPTLFMVFDKAPLSLANLFLTVDLRAVRICMPSGVQTFDYTKQPDQYSPEFFRILTSVRKKNAL